MSRGWRVRWQLWTGRREVEDFDRLDPAIDLVRELEAAGHREIRLSQLYTPPENNT